MEMRPDWIDLKFIRLMFVLLLSLTVTVGCSPEPIDIVDSLGSATVFQGNQTTYVLTNGTRTSDDDGEKLGEIKLAMVNRINCFECPPPNLYEGQEFFGIKGSENKERIALKQCDYTKNALLLFKSFHFNI